MFSLIPGPTKIEKKYLECYTKTYGSSDLEDEFFMIYQETQNLLAQIFKTKHMPIIQTGEAMCSLWGSLNSTLTPGDHVVSICNGLFGHGLADMAETIVGKENVHRLISTWDKSFIGLDKLEEKLKEFHVRLVTIVHCETPSGILNPLENIGKITKKWGSLLYVDLVSSGIGVDIPIDNLNVDIATLGTQKCLSLLPDLSITFVNNDAWNVIRQVNYQGYDAMLPFFSAIKDKLFPYTLCWPSCAALNLRCKDILSEGLIEIQRKHLKVSEHCRSRLKLMNLHLFPKEESDNSPTVTVVVIPDGWTWIELDKALRKRGVQFGGSYGNLSGKVFRIGHMGSQCDFALVDAALNILEDLLKSK